MITYTAQLGDAEVTVQVPTTMMSQDDCSIEIDTHGSTIASWNVPRSDLAEFVSHLRNIL